VVRQFFSFARMNTACRPSEFVGHVPRRMDTSIVHGPSSEIKRTAGKNPKDL